MPSERYVMPTVEQLRQWEEEQQAKEKLNGMRRGLIEAALRRLKKNELIELLMSLDTHDPMPRWSIEAAINVKKPPELLIYDMRHAIDIATRVDPLRVNRNFPYSWQAYEATERGFKALLEAGEMESAKAIAIEFMRKASYQVECSDEGQMLEEIEACLKPVIQAIVDDQPQLHRQWAVEMIQADKVGVICCHALEKIAKGTG